MKPEEIKSLNWAEFFRACVECVAKCTSDKTDPTVDLIHLLCRNEELFQAILPIAKKLGFVDSIQFYHDCYQFLRDPSKKSWRELYEKNLKLERVPGGALDRNINISSGAENKLADLLGIGREGEIEKYNVQPDVMFDQIEINDEFIAKFEEFFRAAMPDIDKMFGRTEGIPYNKIFDFGLTQQDLNGSDKKLLQKARENLGDHHLARFGNASEVLLTEYNQAVLTCIDKAYQQAKKSKGKKNKSALVGGGSERDVRYQEETARKKKLSHKSEGDVSDMVSELNRKAVGLFDNLPDNVFAYETQTKEMEAMLSPMMKFYGELSLLVKLDILSKKNINDQQLLVQKWIEVIARLERVGNHFCAYSIFNALNSKEIMTAHKNVIEGNKTIKKMEVKYSREDGYRHYKKVLKNRLKKKRGDNAVLPFIHPWLRHIETVRQKLPSDKDLAVIAYDKNVKYSQHLKAIKSRGKIYSDQAGKEIDLLVPDDLMAKMMGVGFTDYFFEMLTKRAADLGPASSEMKVGRKILDVDFIRLWAEAHIKELKGHVDSLAKIKNVPSPLGQRLLKIDELDKYVRQLPDGDEKKKLVDEVNKYRAKLKAKYGDYAGLMGKFSVLIGADSGILNAILDDIDKFERMVSQPVSDDKLSVLIDAVDKISQAVADNLEIKKQVYQELPMISNALSELAKSPQFTDWTKSQPVAAAAKIDEHTREKPKISSGLAGVADHSSDVSSTDGKVTGFDASALIMPKDAEEVELRPAISLGPVSAGGVGHSSDASSADSKSRGFDAGALIMPKDAVEVELSIAPAPVPVAARVDSPSISADRQDKKSAGVKSDFMSALENEHVICAKRLAILEQLTNDEREQFKKNYGSEYWKLFESALSHAKAVNSNDKKFKRSVSILANEIANLGIKHIDLPLRLRLQWREADHAMLAVGVNEKYKVNDIVNGLNVTAKYADNKSIDKEVPLALQMAAYHELDARSVAKDPLFRKKIINNFRINPGKYICELTTKMRSDVSKLSYFLRQLDIIFSDKSYLSANSAMGTEDDIKILLMINANIRDYLKRNNLIDSNADKSIEYSAPHFDNLKDLNEQMSAIFESVTVTNARLYILPNLLMLGTKTYTDDLIDNLCQSYGAPEPIELFIDQYQKIFIKRPEIIVKLLDHLFDAYKHDIEKSKVLLKKYQGQFAGDKKLLKEINRVYRNNFPSVVESKLILTPNAPSHVVSSPADPSASRVSVSSTVSSPVPSRSSSSPSPSVGVGQSVVSATTIGPLSPWKTKIFKEYSRHKQSGSEYFGEHVIDNPAFGRQIDVLLKRSQQASCSAAERLNLLAISDDINKTYQVLIAYRDDLSRDIAAGSNKDALSPARLAAAEKYINKLDLIRMNIQQLQAKPLQFSVYGNTVTWVDREKVDEKIHELRSSLAPSSKLAKITISNQATADPLNETINLPSHLAANNKVGVVSNVISPEISIVTVFEARRNRVFIDQQPTPSASKGGRLFSPPKRIIHGMDQGLLTAAIIAVDDARNRFGNKLLIRGASEEQLKAMLLYCAYLKEQGQAIELKTQVGGPNLLVSHKMQHMLSDFEKIHEQIKPGVKVRADELRALEKAEKVKGQIAEALDKASLSPVPSIAPPKPGSKGGGGFPREA